MLSAHYKYPSVNIAVGSAVSRFLQNLRGVQLCDALPRYGIRAERAHMYARSAWTHGGGAAEDPDAPDRRPARQLEPSVVRFRHVAFDIVQDMEEMGTSQALFQIPRDSILEAYERLNRAHDECDILVRRSAVPDALLYRQLDRLRTFLNLKLNLRVTIQVLMEDGIHITVYNGVSRMQPVQRLLLHFVHHQDDPEGAYAFTAHGRLLDPVDATLAWNDLMNPADTQFTICQFQEAEEGAHP